MRVLLTANTSFKIANFRSGLISALRNDGHELAVLSPPDNYTESLQRLGCTTIDLEMDRNGSNPISEARLLIEMYRKIASIAPDYVISYTIKNNIYSGLVCRTLGIPFAPNVTGLGPAFNKSGLLNKVVRLLYRVAFRKASKVFFQNTEDQYTFLRAGLVAHENAELLPGSGVDLTYFTETPLPCLPVRFLLVARMLREKGLEQFVMAAEEIRDEFPEVEFRLLGPLDPDSKSSIERSVIEAWQAADVISYLGAATDVRPHIERAHCVVLPSYYREGTPRALLEAAAMGRPIITTDIPGCCNTVSDGVSGYLVKPRDSRDLAKALRCFLNLSAEERQTMGQAGRALMEAKFSEDIVVDAYLKLFEVHR